MAHGVDSVMMNQQSNI